MAFNSKSGLTKEERERFLRDHGYTPKRSGKGSHEIWEHAELKLLAQTNKVSAPINVMPSASQIPWEITLPDNPAGGTWSAISKFATWCQSTADGIKNASVHEQMRCKIAKDFRKAVADIRQWKKDLRHHLKAGLPLEKAPETPVTYKDFTTLAEKKKQLSKPTV